MLDEPSRVFSSRTWKVIAIGPAACETDSDHSDNEQRPSMSSKIRLRLQLGPIGQSLYFFEPQGD